MVISLELHMFELHFSPQFINRSKLLMVFMLPALLYLSAIKNHTTTIRYNPNIKGNIVQYTLEEGTKKGSTLIGNNEPNKFNSYKIYLNYTSDSIGYLKVTQGDPFSIETSGIELHKISLNIHKSVFTNTPTFSGVRKIELNNKETFCFIESFNNEYAQCNIVLGKFQNIIQFLPEIQSITLLFILIFILQPNLSGHSNANDKK